jgi:hypothetical protein
LNQTYTHTGSDQIAPTIPTQFADKTSLWPPNHKMVDVYLSASDNCGIAGSSVIITSNEPVNDIGDGNTDPDWWIDPTNPLHIQLRAERSGVQALVTPDIGRIYTIKLTVTDACGNSTTATNTVTVAHNITSPNAGASFKIGTTVGLTGTFWDIPGNKHTAKWLIDGTSVNGTVTAEPSGNKVGKVTGSYKPTVAGVYKLRMNVTDQKGVTSYATTNGDFEALLVAYDPNGSYTYGGGKFMSPAGALMSNTSATGLVAFGFTSNYYKNATYPKGETQLDFKVGDFTFSALNFDYLVVNGARAQFKGLGKMTNGLVEQSGLAFILTVIDGQLSGGSGVDKIRMKIYNKNTGQVYYDNQSGSSDADNPVTSITEGTIVVVNPNTATTATKSSGTTTTATTRATARTIRGQIKPVRIIKPFAVKAWPNPSEHQFVLQVEGNNNEAVNIKVFDVLGRQVYITKGAANQNYHFGENFVSGAYIVEVRQGDKRSMIKLIKQ